MKNSSLFRLFALVAAMMCALGMQAAEAYAHYTSWNTTLTFFYDNYRSTRTGTTYDLNTGYFFPDWRSDGTYVNVTKVVFNSSFANARPTTTYGWFYGMENLQSIIGIAYLNTSEVTNMSWMFGYCSSLANLDLSHLNTAKVTNMHAMFSNCESLTNLDVSNFNTVNVTDMSWMFAYCSSLSSIDLSSFRTDNVGDMEYMFYICSDLRTIFASRYWSTAAVTSSTNMFAYCNNLVGGQGTTYDDQHVGAFRAHVDGGPSNPGYFTAVIETHAYACYTPSNTTLTFYYDNLRSTRTGTTYDLNTGSNLPSWDNDGTYANVTNVVFDSSFANARPTSTCAWFGDMEYLQTITGMTYLNTSEVTNMAWMFCWCMSLTNLDLSHFNTAKVTDMNDLFYSCSSLVELNLSSFNTSNVLNMDKMFAFCTSLTTVCVGDGWNASRASTEDMFYHCYNIIGELGTTYNTVYDEHVGEDAAHVDLEDYPGYFVSVNYLTVPYALLTADGKKLTFYHDGQRGTRRGTAKTTYSFDWADNDEPYWWRDDAETEITRVVIDASFADVRPTSTYYWFGEMTKLTGITGMQYLNTSEVTDMSNMFGECIALTSLDVSHFDTKKVKYMRGMFNSCSELTSLDVSGFDTRNVTDMAMMFAYCENLTTLNLRNFDTKKVTDMSGMFEQCSGLTSLDLSNFNTANVTKMGEMFSSCNALTSLDLSSFNTAKVTDMNWMFHTCTNLKTISVSDGWSTAKVTQSGNMFKNCTKLVGGKGTTYNASHVDKAYAHIDGGPSNPGYFTQRISLDEALNVEGGNIHFESTGDYPWQAMLEGDNAYAQSGNAGVANSTSTLTATVTAARGDILFFDFKAWGEGTMPLYDKCSFSINGVEQFAYGAHQNSEWETYSVYLPAGECTLEWRYSKDGSVNNTGDYFAIDNVDIISSILRGDVDGDGNVGIADVTALIDYLLSGNATGINLAAADVDDSGTVNIADVTGLIDYLLSGTW